MSSINYDDVKKSFLDSQEKLKTSICSNSHFPFLVKDDIKKNFLYLISQQDQSSKYDIEKFKKCKENVIIINNIRKFSMKIQNFKSILNELNSIPSKDDIIKLKELIQVLEGVDDLFYDILSYYFSLSPIIYSSSNFDYDLSSLNSNQVCNGDISAFTFSNKKYKIFLHYLLYLNNLKKNLSKQILSIIISKLLFFGEFQIMINSLFSSYFILIKNFLLMPYSFLSITSSSSFPSQLEYFLGQIVKYNIDVKPLKKDLLKLIVNSNMVHIYNYDLLYIFLFYKLENLFFSKLDSFIINEEIISNHFNIIETDFKTNSIEVLTEVNLIESFIYSKNNLFSISKEINTEIILKYFFILITFFKFINNHLLNNDQGVSYIISY